MSQAIADLATRFQDESVGTIGTDLFRGRMPELPDQCVSIQSVLGFPGRLKKNTRVPLDRREILLVLIRAAKFDQEAAMTLAETAWNAAHFYHTTINTREYVWSEADQAPYFLDDDEEKRPMLTFTVTMKRMNV